MAAAGSWLWRARFRVPCFWGITVAATTLTTLAIGSAGVGLDWASFGLAVGKAVNAGRFDLAAPFNEPAFATGLAWVLAATGAGLLAAFLVLHAVAVRISLRRVRLLVESFDNRPSFAVAYDSRVYPVLTLNSLIGHAWKEFDETLLKNESPDAGVIGNTIRPQSFINFSLVRERLTGLKILGSISGYFIGVGLLLTFIGIVLALGRAGAAVGKDSGQMQQAVGDLLQIASFKFATSIAGLGVSLVFAIVARFIVIWIEGGLSRLCEVVESKLKYTAPQSITAEMNEVGKEQRDQLKEINSDRYFSRLANSVAPLIETAMGRAMAPVTFSIDEAIGRLSATSQSGVGELIEKFSASVQGSAGTELRQLGEALGRMQETLNQTQRGLQGTGEDFARRMSEAAENLNRLVAGAGERLEGGAEQSRTALTEVVDALRATFDRANIQLDTDLSNAATGASSKIEGAMSRVMERLDSQLGEFMSGIRDFQSSSASSLTETRQHVAEAQSQAAAAIGAAGSDAAKALETGVTSALARISEEMERFETAMRSGATAYASQASAIGDAASRTRLVADAFAETADQVRGAAAPLVQIGERLSLASTQMNQAIAQSTAELTRANAGSAELASALTAQIETLGTLWAGYKEQFDRVDEALANAVEQLAGATEQQAERLTSFVREMDADLTKISQTLRQGIGDIAENTDDFTAAAEKIARALERPAAE